MKIVFCCANTKAEPWLEGFRRALSGVDIWEWQAGRPQEQARLADYAVVWSPPQAFIDEQSQLTMLFNIGAGVDALLKLRRPAAMQIVRLNDAGMSVQMAEYVCHAVIRYFRQFDRYEADAKSLQWFYRKPAVRSECPIGILGAGVLGAKVAQALRQFDFPVNVYSRTEKHLEGVKSFSGRGQFNAFLQASLVLVNLLPLTAETENILNSANLSQLQKGAYLINVARGDHLVEEDLLALLASGHLSGATLDVFRVEPLPKEHPFWGHPDITITPHASARTLRDESILQIAKKIMALDQGCPIEGLVDPVTGY
jgi:glyoxylate/hydroxypyruvate reductase A